MSGKLTRTTRSQEVVIASGAALSEPVNVKEDSMGVVHMPAAWTVADIGFHVSTEVDGTYLPLFDESGVLVVISGPIADQSYTIPARVAGVKYAKLWSNLAGADENQGAARTLIFDRKA